MPSTRRSFLAAAGTAGVAGLAGCAAFRSGLPDVNPATGLSQDTSHALDNEAVYLAGDASDLPDPPNTADSPAAATAVLATPNADRVALARALRDGKPVAIAGTSCQDALRGLLESVRREFTFGVESVRGRPVPVAVADPRADTVETYVFVDDGGWEQPVLDPFGWALAGRVPECKTFVPESSMDDEFAYAGAATIAGRLRTGETYASRTEASVARQDDERFVRLRTDLHAAANDGYPVEEVSREMDFPNDQHLDDMWPNANTRDGVQVGNYSSPIESRFEIEVTPESDRARATLTGCGGVQVHGAVAYDFRVRPQWKRDELLGSDRHRAEATGRGEWHLDA
jgi:hypothetical protein